MSQPLPKTWEDLQALPEGQDGELVGGQIVLLPRPGARHVETASDLVFLLGSPFRMGRGGPGGWVILFEPELALFDEIRVPDLVGYRKERYERPERGPYTVVPDWVCEVLSPSTQKMDRTEKLPLYARAGIEHVWIVDPLLFTLEVYRLVGEHYSLWLTASEDDRVRAEPFDAVELELGLIWGDRRGVEGVGQSTKENE